MSPRTRSPARTDAAAELTALEHELAASFDLRKTTLALGDGTVELLRPSNPDDLISETDYVRDERLPYWADIWPSSLILSARVAAMHGEGLRLLELGCGVGLVCIAATRAGFAVTGTDYYVDALRFAEINVRRNTSRALVSRHVDWRAFPLDLGVFDVVVASDVLYETSYPALVADALARTVAPEGVALIADPGRVATPTFITECARRGLHVARKTDTPFVEGAIRQTIQIYELSHAPAATETRR